MFPSGYPILDVFGRADGALGANWNGPANGATNSLVIVSGKATPPASAALAASAWKIPLASGLAVYARIDALPAAGADFPQVSMLSNLGGSLVIDAFLSIGSPNTISVEAGSTSAANLARLTAGDWFAATYDGAARTASGWWWDSVTGGPWQNKVTIDASVFATGTQGWLASLQAANTATKFGMFGAMVLPGADQTVNPQSVHGRGAC